MPVYQLGTIWDMETCQLQRLRLQEDFQASVNMEDQNNLHPRQATCGLTFCNGQGPFDNRCIRIVTHLRTRRPDSQSTNTEAIR